MDFKKASGEALKLTSLESAQRTQEEKARQAAEYRSKFIKQQQQQKKTTSHGSVGGPEMSPGYYREKATDRQQAQKRKEDQEAANLDGKSTVLQCIFNLVNILMVRGKILCLDLKTVGTCWLLMFISLHR